MRKPTLVGVLCGMLFVSLLAGCGGDPTPKGIDLSATSIAPPLNCDWADPIDIDVTLSNLGKVESLNTWSVEIRLSDDTTIDGTDTLLDSYTVAGLAAQTDLPGTDSVTIPALGTDGVYYIGYIVDSGNDEDEVVETNNISNEAMYIGAATMPDFVASNLILPDPPKAITGRPFLLEMDVTSGVVPYSGQVKVFAYISDTPGVDPAADRQIGTVSVSNLPSGTPQQISVSCTIPHDGTIGTGEYYIGAYVDADFSIAEENETNNAQDTTAYVGRSYHGSDIYEPDDTGQYATPTIIGGEPQYHTFRPEDEEDWMSVTTTGPATLLIEAYDPYSSDPDVYVYSDPDGINLIGLGFTDGSEEVEVTLSGATTIYIMVNNYDLQLNGGYSFRVTP